MAHEGTRVGHILPVANVLHHQRVIILIQAAVSNWYAQVQVQIIGLEVVEPGFFRVPCVVLSRVLMRYAYGDRDWLGGALAGVASVTGHRGPFVPSKLGASVLEPYLHMKTNITRAVFLLN